MRRNRQIAPVILAIALGGCGGAAENEPEPERPRPARAETKKKQGGSGWGAWGWGGAGMAPAAAYHNAAFDHSAAERDEFITANTQGYRPEGPPHKGRLDTFMPVAVSLKRGKCYRMVLRLDDDATFSEHARAGISFLYFQPGYADVNGGPGIHGPGGVGSGGCPQVSGDATFDLQAYLGSATDKSRIHDLGQGGFTLQLVAKPVSARHLADQRADTERQIQESQEFKERSRRQTCQRCRDQQMECLDGRHRPFGGNCTDEYRFCLQGGSVYDRRECQ